MVEGMLGPYRLEGVIGSGGMGEVHRAYDTGRHRTVALKLLPRTIAADPEYVARFRAEAALAARLSEPHIIPVHDFGEIDGRLFIDMRLVEGSDLAGVLRRDGPLPPARAVDVVTQVAAALDAAHAQGLVHRDIKPANILMDGGYAYVADFGIAHSLGGGGTALTMTGAMVGSLTYMAPERLTTGHGDHRVDVYGLGCLLYELLTGRAPFPVSGVPALLYAHVRVPPPRPSDEVAALPLQLDDVVERAMAKDPEQRYPSAGALAGAAREALDQRVPAAPCPAPARPAAAGADVAAGGGPVPVAWSPPRRRRLPIVVAVLAVLLGGVGSALSLSRPAAAEVVLEARHTAGANPFMPAVGEDSDAVTPEADAGGTVVGGDQGVFGGTRDAASCDPAQMVTFLQSNPDRAAVWAGVQGISTAQIPDYVGGLTPVELRSDTAVTNHGLQYGQAVPYQAVLQTGTSVLVDEYGVPRAKCYCGNPLLPPQPQPAQYFSGNAWPEFRPRGVTTVVPAPVPVAEFRLVDEESGGSFARRRDRDTEPAPDPAEPADELIVDPAEPPDPTMAPGPTAPPTSTDPLVPADPPVPDPLVPADPPPDSGLPVDPAPGPDPAVVAEPDPEPILRPAPEPAPAPAPAPEPEPERAAPPDEPPVVDRSEPEPEVADPESADEEPAEDSSSE